MTITMLPSVPVVMQDLITSQETMLFDTPAETERLLRIMDAGTGLSVLNIEPVTVDGLTFRYVITHDGARGWFTIKEPTPVSEAIAAAEPVAEPEPTPEVVPEPVEPHMEHYETPPLSDQQSG